MSEQEFTPVYLITGFLESGKTQLINSMLTDDNFCARTEDAGHLLRRGR